ncbi:MAG: Ig domain-containing protein, partial [Opitutales bacterium]
AFLAKFNATKGSLTWVERMGGSGSDRALDLAGDGAGGVTLAGRFEDTAIFGSHSLVSTGFTDAFVARYDTSGSCVFASRAGGQGEDEASAIVRSSTGIYFLAGSFRLSAAFGGHVLSSRGGSDAFLAWLSPQGSFSSATSLGGMWSDEALDLALDPNEMPILAGSYRGTVMLGGTEFSSAGDSDAFVAKFDDVNATVLWAKTGGGSGADAARSVAVDIESNRFCLAGFVSPGATFDNLQATGVTTRRSLLVAHLGYPDDGTAFNSFPLGFAAGGSLYQYNFETGPWGLEPSVTVTATNLPEWLTIYANGDGNGTLFGTVPTGENEVYAITLHASDGSSRSTSQTFSLLVGSSAGAPVIVGIPPLQATPLKEYRFDLTAFDPDGDVVVLYAATLPSWLSFERQGRGAATVRGVPTSAVGRGEPIEIIATDGRNETRLAFTLQIPAVWWGTAESLGTAQWHRNWFGQFSLSDTSWIFHEQLGWVFAEGDQTDSVWFWAEGWGWFWTSSEHWNADKGEGHLYSFGSDEGVWMYLRSNGSLENAMIYRYESPEWISFQLNDN